MVPLAQVADAASALDHFAVIRGLQPSSPLSNSDAIGVLVALAAFIFLCLSTSHMTYWGDFQNGFKSEN